MAKKKKDPLGAAAQQVVKKTTEKVVKQTAPKKTAQQKVQSVAKKAGANIVKAKAPGTVKPATKNRTASKPFKASNISGNTGRDVSRSGRKETRTQISKANDRKAFNAQSKRQAKQKVNAVKKGEAQIFDKGYKGAPNRLSQTDALLLNEPRRNEVNYWKAMWDQANKRDDETGKRLAHAGAELARMTNPARVETAGGREYTTFPYSGGTWGDRARDVSESDALANLSKEKGFGRSELLHLKAGVNRDVLAGVPSTLSEFPLRLPEGQNASQLLVENPNARKGHGVDIDPIALRGQSRFTEEDVNEYVNAHRQAAELQSQAGYNSSPVQGPLGKVIGGATEIAPGLGMDMLMNTAIPGSGLVSMGARTWGNTVRGAKEEQMYNGTYNDPHADTKAYLYGTLVTGSEIATEKLFGMKLFGRNVYGKGVKGLEDVINSGVNRAASRLAKSPGGEAAVRYLMNIGVQGGMEGFEEVLADASQHLMPKIYGGDVEGAKELLSNMLYDFAIGATMGGFGGITSARQVTRQTYLDRMKRNAEAISERMSDLGADKEQAKNALSRMTIYQLESLAEASDDVLRNTGMAMGLISSQNANQSLTEASEEQRSEQTIESERPTVSRSKAKDALRKRLRSMDIRDAERLRGIMDGISAEEMDTASKMSTEDLSAWVERRESGEIAPAEQATVVEDVEEEEDEFAATPAQIRSLGNKLSELGVDSHIIARALGNNAVLDELVNMDMDELSAWAEEQAQPTPAQPEALAEQTELLEAQRQERQEEAQVPATPLERSASVLGAAGRTAFISSYNPSKRSDLYTAEAYRAYNAGFTGNARPTLYKTLNRASSEALYQAGVIDRLSSMRARENKKRNAIVFDRNTSELYWDENVERAIAAYSQAEGVRRFTQKDAQHLDRIVRALGKKAFFVESIDSLTEPGKHDIANGSYADGILKISLKTVDPISFTFGHEITHAMAEMSPKEYKRLERYVMGLEQSESQLAAIRKAYEDLKLPLSQETAIEEVVADYVGQMVTDLDLLERFARQVDRNVLQKFLDALRSLARKLTGKDKEDVNKAVKLVENMLNASVKQNKRMQNRGQSSTSTGERFSIKNPVEASGNLVALHNLTEDKLLKSIENGGFPMPSIAVTRADVEHSNFGDITLLMGRDTIDPEADKRNKVYSADVWSPTFPQYEYEPDEKVEKRLRDKFYELSKKHGRDVAEPLYAYGVTLEDTLNRVGGYEEIISREKDNINMKKVFLADKDRPIPGDVYKTKTNRIPEERINEANSFVENFGEENIANALSTLPRGSINLHSLREYFKENEDAVKDAFRRTWLQMSPGLSEQDASDAADAVNVANFRTMLLIIRRIQEGSIETQSQEYDPSASRKAVDDAVDQEEYEAWLEDLFKGVEKRRGIYNGKDFYTPSGKRRSFQQTHFEVTLENIVRAMQSQNEKNTAGFHGSKTVRAASAKSFKNVAQMHEDEGRLQNRTPEEAERLTAEMDSRLSDIINRIYGLKKHSSYDNPFIEFDSIGEIILEVAETGRFTQSNVKNIFSGYEYDLPKDISDDIVQLIKDIQEMPVNIFEAKPQRVVGLDEIVAAIVPEDTSVEVLDALDENGIEIKRYAADDNQSRMKVVNETAEQSGTKFSLKRGYQPSTQRDSDYLKAVQDGDMDTAQRMVDEAAKETGFGSPKLYHGTNAFGFTDIDTKKSNDKISFFATTSAETAGTYSGTDTARVIGTNPGEGSSLGMYQLYANTDNLLELDAGGAESNHIALGQVEADFNYDSGGRSWRSYATAKQIAKFAKRNGYSGVIIRNVIDTATPESRNESASSDVYVFFDPRRQVKSADPVVYDDNGNLIPLSERFDPDKPDIRWSIRGGLTYDQMVERYGSIKPGERRARNVAVPKQTSDNTKVHQTIRTIMEAGRTPEDILPRLKEMIESGEFSYEVFGNREGVEYAQGVVADKGFAEAYKDWSSEIEKKIVSPQNVAMGWVLYDTAVENKDWDMVARISMQMAKYANTIGQGLQAMRILKMFSPEMQLAVMDGPKPERVRKKLEKRKQQEEQPADTYDEEEEEDDDIDLPGAFFGEEDEERPAPQKKPRKKPQRRTPREEQSDTNEDESDTEITQKDVEETAEYQAKHSKSTLIDMWNSWRYLAMLFNARTHIRNIVGNLGFAPIVMSKNVTATAAEIAIYHTVGRHFGMKRTKGVYNPRMFAYAWKDFEQMRPTIMGEAKYEGQEPKPDEVVFRGILAPLEKARKLNSAALDLEDAWFSRPQYANALAQYMAANGITVEMMETGAGEITRGPHKGEHITAKIMDEARAYAVKEAQKATYRDLNDLSQFFMRVGKPQTDDPTKVEKVVHVLIEGVIPFRKTPANILVRAMEYSPVGFLHGMKKLLYDVPATFHVRNRLEKLQQKIDAGEELTDNEKKFRKKASKFEPTTVAEALDRLCSGMSGTAIFALGMTLAKLGVLVAKTDNGDDDQKYFTKLLGHQQWALEVGGYSITIDWLAPEVVPLFMGAQYFTGFNEGDPIRNFSSLADSLSMVIDPVLELSCMSGIQEALNNAAAFSEGDVNTMVGLASSLGLSYLSQGIPTLFGQLERASQEERMTTFTQDEQLIPSDWQYQIGKLSAKIPVWDYHQIPYVDSWGNTETETSLWKRIVSNMVLPAYVKKIDTRDVNKELQRLYDATGDGDVLPKPGWKTYRYTDENGKNQTVYLTEEEYLAYGRAKGRNQFDLVSKFLKSNAYKNMSDPDRANVLDDIYYYSEYKAQKEYINNYKGEPYSWVSNYETFSNTVGGYDVADFIIVRGATRDVKGLYDPKKPGSNAISGTSACNKLLAIYNSGVHIPSDPAQREAFMEALDVAKTYRGYNKAQAEDHLNKTRKKYGITD